MIESANSSEVSKPTALIVGFGDIGERVARLLQSSYAVSALIRKPARAAVTQDCSAVPIDGDLALPATLKKMAALKIESLFHFAPPPNLGEIDTNTINLLDALTLASHQLKQLIYISTTGVYGDCAGAIVNETTPLRPQTERAARRVSAETALLAWCLQHSVALTILRAPGIYALERLPIARLRASTPAIVAAEDSYSNHIHADDLAAACVAALLQTKTNIFNIVDDSDMKMGDYFDLVADHFYLPRPPRVPRELAESQVSPQMLSFMRESRRIVGDKMKLELGLTLRYPTVADFLNTISHNIADLDKTKN